MLNIIKKKLFLTKNKLFLTMITLFLIYIIAIIRPKIAFKKSPSSINKNVIFKKTIEQNMFRLKCYHR